MLCYTKITQQYGNVRTKPLASWLGMGLDC